MVKHRKETYVVAPSSPIKSHHPIFLALLMHKEISLKGPKYTAAKKLVGYA